MGYKVVVDTDFVWAPLPCPWIMALFWSIIPAPLPGQVFQPLFEVGMNPTRSFSRPSNVKRPIIAITMGDPAGIGPEICLKLIAANAITRQCVPLIFGDACVLKRVADQCGLAGPRQVVSYERWFRDLDSVHESAIVDVGVLTDGTSIRPGTLDAATGLASFRYLESAIDAAMANKVDAVATGPIHKEALRAAKIPFPGHTEILAAKTKARRVCMMLTSDKITCSLVTTHVGYKDVPELLSVQRIVDVIQLSHEAMLRLRGRSPKMLVCGLNPHAGEHGLFGQGEEERVIAPAVAIARDEGIDVEGPLPPDTAFLAQRRNETDCFVCMYHDQGLIPVKALAFGRAVNITLGLPIIRTSVDHGTAFDIAWQGKADVSSLVQAVHVATQLACSPAVCRT